MISERTVGKRNKVLIVKLLLAVKINNEVIDKVEPGLVRRSKLLIISEIKVTEGLTYPVLISTSRITTLYQ